MKKKEAYRRWENENWLNGKTERWQGLKGQITQICGG